jgi:glutaconate CoA-transferase subunit A
MEKVQTSTNSKKKMKPPHKVTTISEAVAQFIHDGAHISFGGFTINRQPMACAYEMIRQGKKNLHVYIHSGGQTLDLLIGAGCVKAVEIAYGANGRFAPTCIRFRKAVERGELLVEDYTNYQMTLRFQAGAMGVPYLPVTSGMGTDIVKKWGFDAEMRINDPRLPNQKLLVQNNPFAADKQEPVVLVPAINPDVTVIHAQQADVHGTVRISGLTFADVEQAKAARHVIVTCEELVEPEVLRAEPERNQLPFFAIDAVVHIPHGAHPSACYGYYDYDAEHLNLYRSMAVDDKTFPDYLDEYVLSVENHEHYLKKIGSNALARIKAVPPYGYAPGLKRG